MSALSQGTPDLTTPARQGNISIEVLVVIGVRATCRSGAAAAGKILAACSSMAKLLSSGIKPPPVVGRGSEFCKSLVLKQ
jgi:hypothetical protein